MRRAMIVCHPQTEAFSCLRMLEGAGVSAVLRKPPRAKQDNACAWGVRIRAADLMTAQRRMQEKNFMPIRVYTFDEENGG